MIYSRYPPAYLNITVQLLLYDLYQNMTQYFYN